MKNFTKQPIFIIIPVHNRKTLTLDCLENLALNGDLQRFHVIVIDDGSTDGTVQAINNIYPDVIILSGDGNLWWTGAIAKGMEYAYQQGGKYFIWLNDDCRFSNRAISDIISFSQNNPDVIVGCQGVELDNSMKVAFGGKVKTWQGYRFINAPPSQLTPCDLLSGNLVCVPRSVINKIGYPNPKLTPHYGGDSLFIIKAKKSGIKIVVDNRNSVFNLPGESHLYPKDWLLEDGKPLLLIKLVFTPQSGLNWRVWLLLNWEAYYFWGIVMFFKKYIEIFLITILRFLPLYIRQNLARKKQYAKN